MWRPYDPEPANEQLVIRRLMCSTLSPHMALKRTCSSSGITSQLELNLPHICTSVSSLRASASRIWSEKGQKQR
ncbi:hypothetical protein EYF80_000806 [Liparis tanakae]|uniref:Uncharacterized protein n=1 Tax=Liparis tanakae TaxID=230148 RepID=A0A4Z2JGZ4_9TELE|nr:hypothetical protein EYF80_000806 [Liparis tanakae]